MVKYTSAILASAALATTVVADPVCSVVTEVVTGDWFWVADPTWADWSAAPTTTTTTKKPAVTTTTAAWVDPTWLDWTTSTTTTTKKATTTTAAWVDPTWLDWTTSTTTTTKKATTTTSAWVDPTWLDWTTSTTTTKAATTTTSAWVDPTWLDWTSTTAAPTSQGTTTVAPTTTTTQAPAPVATCPASNGETLSAGGSCQCEFQVNCGVHADTSSNPAFWNEGTTDSLAACLTICDNNDKCDATIWCDDVNQCGGDYHVCWQTNGLGGIIGSGYGQISYKQTCKGGCTQSYES